MSRVAKRYAKALLQSAKGDAGQARRTLASFEVLLELFEKPESAKILNSPVMPQALKRDILEYGLKVAQAEANVSQIVDYLLVSRRETIIPKLVESYRGLIDEEEGIARGEVVSAVPLSEEERSRLKAELKQLLRKDIVLKESIDPNLLGGMVARVGHFLLDMSLKTRLEEIGQHVIKNQIQNAKH